MESNYIESRDGRYWIKGQRVSLDSIVYCFREGLSPETIVHDCFPSLTLEQTYGAITYYLAHQSEIDEYLEQSEEEWETFRAHIEEKYPQSRRILQKLRNLSTRRT